MYNSENLKHCLYTSEDGGVYGEGNHVINLRNSKGLITKSFIMMDTNSYTDEDPLGIRWIYDNIHEDQIEWYRNVINTNNSYNQSTPGDRLEEEGKAGRAEHGARFHRKRNKGEIIFSAS